MSRRVARPRLLVLTSTLPRWAGDSEPRFVLDLARAMADRFDPLILAPMAKGAARRETIHGVEIARYRYAPFHSWERLASPGAIMPNLRKQPWLYALVPALLAAQFIALVRLLRRERFDAVHCHWIIPQGLVLAFASLFVRVPPTLLTCHGADAFTLQAVPFRWLKRWILGRADAITVVSSEIAAHLRDERRNPLHHVPMGVDLDRFEAGATKGVRPPVILFAGRLAAKKGVHTLIEALADLRLAERGARLRIVGDGPLREHLQALAAAAGVSQRVQFAGAMPHDRLAAEMRNAHIFCAPFVVAEDGDREGTPTVLLEAAASAMPIVTTDVGGCGDIVSHGRSGWLIAPGDSAALADALVAAIDDPALAARMGEQARLKAQSYAWPRIAERYGNILDLAAARERRAA